MAIRFRKSIKIAPGIRLNFSKSGVSTSIGRPGATVNFSKRGTRVTAGIPGSGLSASKLYKSAPKPAQEPSADSTGSRWKAVGWVAISIMTAIAVSTCSSKKSPSTEPMEITATAAAGPTEPLGQAYKPAMEPETTKSIASPIMETRYVGPTSLNVRSSPNGEVIASLKHGTPVQVHAKDGEWSRITSVKEAAKWVASAYLCTWHDCSDIPKWKPTAMAIPTPEPVRQAAPKASSTYGCACSSSSNCFGPRGGRYCITSGGNKRYR